MRIKEPDEDEGTVPRKRIGQRAVPQRERQTHTHTEREREREREKEREREREREREKRERYLASEEVSALSLHAGA